MRINKKELRKFQEKYMLFDADMECIVHTLKPLVQCIIGKNYRKTIFVMEEKHTTSRSHYSVWYVNQKTKEIVKLGFGSEKIAKVFYMKSNSNDSGLPRDTWESSCYGMDRVLDATGVLEEFIKGVFGVHYQFTGRLII
jgi:hypothetical protein